MLLALITFFSGLAISAVAIYYSVIGLAAIFAAAVIPIIVMGSILEVSKLVAAWWLKANWHRAPFLLKSYMLLAVVVLMLITSMGIFGFLSKAHTEQAVPVGDNMATIQIIDERIAIEQEVIAQARQDIDVLNQQIGRFTELGAVSRGVNARNQQREERQALTQQVIQAQERISEMRAERAPFAASLRAIEAEVGPIKYIAKLIYGDSTDANMLEQAVVWIIIVIVFVFDPLAVLLLLASQMSFQWAREEKNKAKDTFPPIHVTDDPVPHHEPDDGILTDEQVTQIKESALESTTTAEANDSVITDSVDTSDPHPIGWMYTTPIQDTAKDAVILLAPTDYVSDTKRPSDYLPVTEDYVTEDSILQEAAADVRAAMSQWKAEHPNDNLKHQRSLLERGIIKKLPWEDYVGFVIDKEHEAAAEAAKWAQEQLHKAELSKKKDNSMDGEGGTSTGEENQRTIIDGYVQNAEQSKSTLWQRVKNIKND